MPRLRRPLIAATALAIALSAYLSDLVLHPAAPTPTGPVAPGVFALADGHVNAWAVEHSDGVLLVDAGADPDAIERALAECGIDPARITRILLTHTDRDHTGFLPRTGTAEILLHAAETRMTDGSTSRAFGIFYNRPLPRPARTIRDGETLAVGGRAIRCLAAPGHTAGHGAWRVDDLLFTGDAFLLDAARKPRPFWRLFDMDRTRAAESAAALLSYARGNGVKGIFTGHSGWIGTESAGK